MIDPHSTVTCCAAMRDQLAIDCPDHGPDPYACPDAVIVRDSQGRYGIPIHDGGSSYIAINHCPWCGMPIA